MDVLWFDAHVARHLPKPTDPMTYSNPFTRPLACLGLLILAHTATAQQWSSGCGRDRLTINHIMGGAAPGCMRVHFTSADPGQHRDLEVTSTSGQTYVIPLRGNSQTFADIPMPCQGPVRLTVRWYNIFGARCDLGHGTVTWNGSPNTALYFGWGT